MQEKDNILRILEESKEAVKRGDVIALKELSNQTIHTSSVSQDPDNIAVAVIIYSLSKILERKKYQTYPGWDRFYKNYLSAIDRTIISVQNNKDKETKANLELINKVINSLSGDLKIYIQDVFRKAKINKASKIYEHGISMEQTSRLLGLSMFEIASYIGQSEIPDEKMVKTQDVKSRIKLAMEMFK